MRQVDREDKWKYWIGITKRYCFLSLLYSQRVRSSFHLLSSFFFTLFKNKCVLSNKILIDLPSAPEREHYQFCWSPLCAPPACHSPDFPSPKVSTTLNFVYTISSLVKNRFPHILTTYHSVLPRFAFYINMIILHIFFCIVIFFLTFWKMHPYRYTTQLSSFLCISARC